MSNLNFELKILDEDYAKIGRWNFNQKDLAKYLRIINRKYSLGISIKDNKKNDSDISWIR